MKKTPFLENPPRSLSALFALAGALACGAASVDTLQGSETHFLARCSAECGSGLACIEGVCSRACVADSECTALSDGATCSSGVGLAHCIVPCSGDGECRAQNGDWSCAAASCVGSPAMLTSTGPIGPAGEASCPTFSGGVQQPSEVQTTFAPVPGSTGVQGTFADASGVYWVDFDGRIFGVKKGDASATSLVAAATPGVRLGLIGDANRLYWTEASTAPSGPPGRLLSVRKDGGSPELMLESPTQVLSPIGVGSSGRLFVADDGGYLNALSASGTLERVANLPPSFADLRPQLVDDQVYWIESAPTTDRSRVALFAATPGGSAPVRLREIEAVPFVAGRGVVLWTPTETSSDPLQVIQHFMMLNENTGCVQPLPSVERSIGQTLIDDRHVYWKSFDVAGDPAGPTPILRVDLRTGRFEQVATPGLEVTSNSNFAAQDADTLYLRQGPDERLIAVHKPD